MTQHLHFCFGHWQNASRAWRNGMTAIEHGYATKAVYIGYKKHGLPAQEEVSPGLHVHRIGGEPVAPGKARILRALSLPRWWRACIKEVSADDVSLVVAHSLAALPVSVWFARRHKLPLLYDAHELESERNGWTAPIRKIARFIEARYIHKAHHTMVVSESIQEWYSDAYAVKSLSTLRNVPAKPTKVGKSNLRETLGIPDDAMVFVYCGSIAKGRYLNELADAFKGLNLDRHIVFLGSDGGEWDNLARRCADIPNVHLHPAVPQSELVTLMSGADVGLSVLNVGSLSYYYALPNKLFEYAAAGLAICVGPGKEMERFAREYPASRSTELSAEALRDMAQSWTREEINQAQDAIAAFEPPSWDKEQYVLLDAFDAAIRNSGGTPPIRPSAIDGLPENK